MAYNLAFKNFFFQNRMKRQKSGNISLYVRLFDFSPLCRFAASPPRGRISSINQTFFFPPWGELKGGALS